MSEMADRVAQALMRVTAEHDCGDLKLKHHYEMARAAIEAMREPTEAMLWAAAGPVATHAIWQQMIDAALSK